MNQGTKQRIVGTVVLLTLAFIFLPIVFDGQGSYEPAMTSRIPDSPQVSILPEPVQSRPIIIAETETEREAELASPASNDAAGAEVPVAVEAAPESVGVTTSEPVFSREVPQLDRAGLPQAWVVQLASFADVENARNLLARLQSAGYKAYIRSVVGDQGGRSRVLVGPWVVRARADETQTELQAQFQLAGMVVAYEMLQL
ncbi:MAG: SPOR domain-containing protein [Pseudohongiellaceae bacterium]